MRIRSARSVRTFWGSDPASIMPRATECIAEWINVTARSGSLRRSSEAVLNILQNAAWARSRSLETSSSIRKSHDTSPTRRDFSRRQTSGIAESGHFLRFPATTHRSDPFCTVFPKGSSDHQLTGQGEVVVSGSIFYSKRSTIVQRLNSNLLTE
jgi:hypothetical protein